MLICLDCGTILRDIELQHNQPQCPVCKSDNIWDDELEMYVNDRGST